MTRRDNRRPTTRRDRGVGTIVAVPLLAAALLSAALLAAGCGRDGAGVAEPDARSSSAPSVASDAAPIGDAVRIVDLTHPLSPDGLYWPSGKPFEHRRLDWGMNEAGYWYAAAEFASPEHLGTHLDAPIHFAEQGWDAAEIPADRLVADGVLVDIADRAEADPDATLVPADITTWEARHGRIPPAAIVLVRTGWSERWPDWERYYGSETPMDVATLHFPGISPDAARALIERGIAGVGIDTASIDPGIDTGFETHRVLGAENIFNLENLANLGDLPESGFTVAALPMKIAGGTGGPARVIALVAR